MLPVPLRGSTFRPVLRAEGAALGALRGSAPPGWRGKLCRDFSNICRLISRLGWVELGPSLGWLAAGAVERPAAGGAGRSLDDGMDWIDLIDGIDGSAGEEGFSFMLGAAAPARCSFSRTAGRSLIRMVRAGASAGPVAGGAEGSAGAAALCGRVPFTWAAFSLGVGPGRWRELAAVSWLGGPPASGAADGVPEGSAPFGASWGRSLIPCSGFRADRGRSWANSSSTAQLPPPST